MKKIKILEIILAGFVVASLSNCDKPNPSDSKKDVESSTDSQSSASSNLSTPSESSVSSELSVPSESNTPSESVPSISDSESSSESETPVDTKVYVDDNWTPVGNEKAYYYEDGKIICNNIEDLSAHFNHSSPNLNLYKEPVGANYSVEVQYVGTYDEVDVEMNAGVVAWYQDVNNYVVVGTQWANWDRPHEVREVFVTGLIDGAQITWMDMWTDNCGIYPSDGISLKVSKEGKNFTYVAKSGNLVIKEGKFLVNGTESETASVGIFGTNDSFAYSGFATQEIIPETKSTYSYTMDSNNSYTLELDSADMTFVLKQTEAGVVLPEVSGTYTLDGRNVTLNCANESILYAKIYSNNNTFEFYTPSSDVDGDAIVLDGTASKVERVVRESLTGDYVASFDFAGTYTEAGHAVKVGFNPWYVDESNYINMYVEWSASDRSHEIREVQITGVVNGTDISWNDHWCDGSNKLVSDGFHMVIRKTDKTISFVLTSGTFTKEGSRTIDNMDTSVPYSTKLYAEGDTISYRNLELYQDVSALYDVSGTGTAVLRDTGLVLNDVKALLKEEQTGDYQISLDFVGTYTEAGHAVKVGFNPWYVDENNYINMYVEWSASDRSHEIREVQITGVVNGTDISWNDHWCDGSNKLVSDGFHMVIRKTDKTISFVLTSGTFTKEGSRTIDNMDTNLSYRVGYYAEGDTITLTNLVKESL